MANRNPLGATPEEFSARCRQMDKDRSLIEAYDMVLFVQNTGALYPRSLALAKTNAGRAEWYAYIRTEALPAYRRDCHMPYARMTSDGVHNTLDELIPYYAEHIRELG